MSKCSNIITNHDSNIGKVEYLHAVKARLSDCFCHRYVC